uniref:GEO12017p1 n=1 Tax=Drosophila melanogaster TaxID=7227 RepID=Q9VUG4_DROME|eukprot:NP_648713.1 goddard [Drosophila melanogaster]
MSDDGSDIFQDLESYEPYTEGSQNNSDEATAVGPLDTSEDARFSEQVFSNIQERLNRIINRISMANSAVVQMKRKLHARIPSVPVGENADQLAGGDNPMRFENVEQENETTNQ